ncbi:MAG TPA: hypothetical protein VK111_07505 [Virgibacillus sp.]|nr:hypothetical protein [Virgibacillus sp.]
MAGRKKPSIKIDRKNETRTKEISQMINEGGLGSDFYYDIKKTTSSREDNRKQKDS